METKEQNKSPFNILIIGKDFVGLTAFCYKFKTGKFNPNLLFNTSIDSFITEIKMKDGEKVPFRIYDTKGQERYRKITQKYFKYAHGFILIYSIDKKESFDDLENWIQMLKEENSIEKPIFLLGNKKDLENEREITKKQGENFAEKNGFIFSECSVKNDSWDDIKSIVEDLAEVIYEISLGNNKATAFEQLKEEKEKKEELERTKSKLKNLEKYLSF